MVIIIKIMMPAIKLIQVLSTGVQERAGYWLDRPGVPATICVKNGRVLAQIKKQTPANEMAKAGKAARWGESGNGQTAWPKKFSCESAYFSCCSDYSPLCRKESALKIKLLTNNHLVREWKCKYSSI